MEDKRMLATEDRRGWHVAQQFALRRSSPTCPRMDEETASSEDIQAPSLQT